MMIFNYKYGELKFIGRDLLKIVFPTEHVFPKDVFFLYYPNSENFTRLVEYKKFTRHKSKTSLIFDVVTKTDWFSVDRFPEESIATIITS